MNSQFLIAIGFGFGVAGLLRLNNALAPNVGLTSRVTAAHSHQQSTATFQDQVPLFRLWIKKIWHKRSTNEVKALFELPELLDLIAVGLLAGDGVYKCLSTIVPRTEGVIARELSKTLRSVDYGGALATELRSTKLSQPLVLEFLNKTATSLERGTALADLLTEQSMSVRSEIRNQLLKQAGKNETRMLIPLVFLILPITVLFAIYPSLELLNFGFI